MLGFYQVGIENINVDSADFLSFCKLFLQNIGHLTEGRFSFWKFWYKLYVLSSQIDLC